jgi:hypothetical protein
LLFSGCHSFSEVMRGAGTTALGRVSQLTNIIQMDAPFNIQFTSGTTGTGTPRTIVLDLDPVGEPELLEGSGSGSGKNHAGSGQLRIRNEFETKLL